MPAGRFGSATHAFAMLTLLAISLPPAQSSAQSAVAAPSITNSQSSGTGPMVPGTATPTGCLQSMKEACTFDIRGSERGSTYKGVGELTERITIDFTKPLSSGAGVCFPQFGVGKLHTSSGDYNFYNQGETCGPPSSAGVAPGFHSATLNAVITGGTGQYQHAVGTLAVTVVVGPAITLYHTSGAFVGIEPSH